MIAVPREPNGNPKLVPSLAHRPGCKGCHMVTDSVAAIDQDQSVFDTHLRLRVAVHASRSDPSDIGAQPSQPMRFDPPQVSFCDRISHRLRTLARSSD